MTSQPRVTGLWIYPIKSCRGISMQELEITPLGPKFDRQWMIVDSENKFITLRTVSKMAEIKTAIQGPFLHLYAGGNKILIDINKECETVETVTVWKDSFLAGVESKDVNEALSDFFSKTVKLVRYQKESFRDLKQAGTEAVKQVMFADSRPILLINENSLQDLNQKLDELDCLPSELERFRANIIIDGLPAYEEDQAQNIKIGKLIFENPKLCARCPVITKDVETGKVVSKETLEILARDRKMDGNKVMFGVNWTPAATGVIRVGDIVSSI